MTHGVVIVIIHWGEKRIWNSEASYEGRVEVEENEHIDIQIKHKENNAYLINHSSPSIPEASWIEFGSTVCTCA